MRIPLKCLIVVVLWMNVGDINHWGAPRASECGGPIDSSVDGLDGGIPSGFRNGCSEDWA